MINQDDFNKVITSALMLFCMIMFAFSWYTGKLLDIQGFLILLAPIFTHLGHIVTDNTRAVATIKKEEAVAVSSSTSSNGGIHA